MKIRNITEEDYGAIISVIDDWWDGRRMADMLPKLFFQHFQDTSYVVEEDRQIVAFIIGFISQTFPEQAYIHFVGVHPKHRSCGLARQLYDQFFYAAKDRGCTEVRSVTSPINKGSIAFHTSMGFRIEQGDDEVDGVQVKTNYDGRGQSRVRFVRELAQRDPVESALVVIDVQVGMFDEANAVYEGNRLLEKIDTLIAKARVANVPIVYVRHDGGEGSDLAYGSAEWQIHPAIGPRDMDVVIDKRTPDAFHHTNLDDFLAARQVKRLILCGIQSDVCIDTTCRRAFSLGYDVMLARDAHSTWDCGDLSAQQIIGHHNDVLRWFADVRSVEDIVFDGTHS